MQRSRTVDALDSLDRLGCPGVDVVERKRRRLRQKTPSSDEHAPPTEDSRSPSWPSPDISKFTFAKDFSQSLMANMTLEYKHALTMALAGFSELCDMDRLVTIRVGTMCSGSEIYLSMLRHLSNHIRKDLGHQVRFVHLWSFEWIEKKQEWIRANWNPPKLFADVTAISDRGTAFDVISQADAVIDDVDLLIAGFSCCDASRPNPHHAERLTVAATGEFSTGSTLHGVAKAVRMLKPKKVILEHVESLEDKPERIFNNIVGYLQDSDFDTVRAIFNNIGYACPHAVFSTVQTGLPVNRQRLYIECRRMRPDANIYQTLKTEKELEKKIGQAMTRLLSGSRRYMLDEFFLPDYKGLASDWFFTQHAVHFTTLERVVALPAKEEKWPAAHRAQWRSTPHAEDKILYQCSLEGNVYFENMSARMQDALLLKLCTSRFPGPTSGIIPLEVSSDRSPLWWIVALARPMLGVEALLLQGADLQDLGALRPGVWGNSFLRKLAGNAFNSAQLFAFLLAGLSADSEHMY
jgi:site-specific DNA-cytosine methylase